MSDEIERLLHIGREVVSMATRLRNLIELGYESGALERDFDGSGKPEPLALALEREVRRLRDVARRIEDAAILYWSGEPAASPAAARAAAFAGPAPEERKGGPSHSRRERAGAGPQEREP